MKIFDPLVDIENSHLILDQNKWPNFHDAEVINLNIWRGDVRPEENIWIGPVVEVTFDLCALEKPFLAILKFHDCQDIRLQEFNEQNALYDLRFQYQPRGQLRDGSAMTPHILVDFEQAFNVKLSLKCFKVEVLEKKILDTRF